MQRNAKDLRFTTVPLRIGRFTVELTLVADAEDGALLVCAPDGLDRAASLLPGHPVRRDVSMLRDAVAELQAYAAGALRAFVSPLRPLGTPFQLSVWTVLRNIPFGTTRRYGDVAAELGRPGAARAVGQACRRNPLLGFVPCHRVVGGGGAPRGYAGGPVLHAALCELEGLVPPAP